MNFIKNQSLIFKFICAAFTCLFFSNASAQASEANWPSKPIKYVVPFGTGGVSDNVARLIAQHLSIMLKQSVIVENKPGVSGIVGTQLVAKSSADGYTIMGGTITTHAVNPFFAKNLGYDPVVDFVPLAMVGTVSNVLVVPANSKFNNVQEIIKELKRNPDSLTYGSSGAGTSQHLSGQLFQSLTGTKMRQIMYKGGSQAMVDLAGGQLDMVFETYAAAQPMIEAKKVKVLGVTSAKRLAELPNVPTISEAGVPGFEMQSWQGVFAPGGTPSQVVEKLSRNLSEIIKSPEVGIKLRAMGVEPDGRESALFAAFQKAEIAKWAKVVSDAGIKAD
ncbi:MAG TPA: MFS transporter [Alcaligenaceae bacterium]|nr:MFS transporter [Alcaligenaceae bacterium]